MNEWFQILSNATIRFKELFFHSAPQQIENSHRRKAETFTRVKTPKSPRKPRLQFLLGPRKRREINANCQQTLGFCLEGRIGAFSDRSRTGRAILAKGHRNVENLTLFWIERSWNVFWPLFGLFSGIENGIYLGFFGAMQIY